MRQYIMRFKQKFLIDKNMTAQEMILVDYMVNFFSSGNAVSKLVDGKLYFWLTYDKVTTDLPILKVQKRQLQRLFSNLEEKGIIKKYVEDNQMYITFTNALWNMYDRFDTPYGNDDMQNNKLLSQVFHNDDIPDMGVCQKCPLIVCYNKNYINIFFYNPNQKAIDGNKFCDMFLKLIREEVSQVLFFECFDRIDVQRLSKNHISLWADNVDWIYKQPKLAERVEKVAKVVAEKIVA